MNDAHRKEGALPPTTGQTIKEACDRFEAAWKVVPASGPAPRIEDYLRGVAASEHPMLLRELIQLDVTYRRRNGAEPCSEDYLAAFPTLDATTVARLIDECPAPPESPATDPGADPARIAEAGGDSHDWPETVRGSDELKGAAPSWVGSDLPHLPGYEVLAELGRGGMGVVYQARQFAPDRLVALKMIRSAQLAGAEDVQLFRREANEAARLDHANIVPVFEVNEHAGQHYFTMKLVAGGSLAGNLRRYANDPKSMAQLLATVARAVHYAHQRQLLHRDLKPGNILLDSAGQPYVADFGLAKRMSVAGDASHGVGAGTPEYMAPEQARGEARLTTAADVYALGGILYALLAGRPPFRGATPWETIDQVLAAEPALPPSTYWPRCPPDLETICLKSLQKEPARRYGSAEALADDLQRYLEGRPIQARRVGPMEHVAKWCRRRPASAALVVVSVLALAVVMGVSGYFLSRQAEQRGAAQARREQIDPEALQALRQAQTLCTEGWEKHDLLKLIEARAEADRAADIARYGSATAAILEETAAFQAEARGRLQRAQTNRTLLSMLLDVSAPRETASYHNDGSGRMMTAVALPSTDEQYAAAFRRWGLDVDGTAEADVAARLHQEPDVVVQEVIAALDGWMLARRAQDRPAQNCQRLVRIAERLERSERGRQLRRLLVDDAPPRPESVAGLVGGWPRWPAVWELGRARGLRTVLELQHQMDPATAPTLAVVQMARVSSAQGSQTDAENLLRQALAARPNDVVLLSTLGQMLEEHKPPRLGEAIECYRAARALNRSLGVKLAQTLGAAGRWQEDEDILRNLVDQQPNNPVMYLFLSYTLVQQRKCAGAAIACRKAIDLKPDEALAYNNLGVALRDLKKPDEAGTALRKAIALKADYAEAYSNLGGALRDLKKLDEAVSAQRKAIALKPDYALAHNNLGTTLHDLKKLDQAVSAHRKAIALKPDFAVAYTNLGTVLRDQKRLDEAVRQHRKAIALKPDYASAYNNLGVALADQNQLGEALAAHRKAIELDPDFALAYTNLGNILRVQKKLDEAVAAHRKAIALDPDYADAYNNLGAALSNQKKLDEAVSAYRKAIELKPDYADAYINLGNALLGLRKLHEAEAAFRKAVQHKPDYAEAYSDLGVALADQNQLNDAVSAYRKAIELKPNLAKAYNNLGNALRVQRKLSESVAALRKAIELRPDYAYAHNNLGTALYDQKKLDEAVAAYRKAIALKPDYAYAFDNLGTALRDQEKLDEAVTAYRKAVALKYFGAYNNLGLALLRQQKLGAAEEAWQKAIDSRPDDPAPQMNLGLLLAQKTQFKEASAALQKGADLLPEKDPRRPQFRQLAQQCRRLATLDNRLAAVLKGTDKPASAAERMEFAQLCIMRKLFAAAARFHRDAFAVNAKLVENVPANTRHIAACCAALAGCGQGKDADKLTDKERAKWRQQALDWLRADLSWWGKALNNDKKQAALAVLQKMKHWQNNGDLAGVRDKTALAKLPAEERTNWQQLWDDVARLIKRVESDE